MKILRAIIWLIFACDLGFALGGCNYEVALTAKPTRAVDQRLLGDWVSTDPETHKEELMQVRSLDDSTYVVAFDRDLYRAYHSDFAGRPFLSVQDLNATNRLYVYLTAELSAEGGKLTLRTVSTKVVPEKTKRRTELQELIRKNLSNPDLLGDPLVFSKSAPRKN